MALYSAYSTQPVPIKVYKVKPQPDPIVATQLVEIDNSAGTTVLRSTEINLTQFSVDDVIEITGALSNNGIFRVTNVLSADVLHLAPSVNSNEDIPSGLSIQLLTQELEFVDVVTNYTSYSFTRSLTGIGTFEIVMSADLLKASNFQKDYVIQIGDDPKKQGQIKKIQRSITTVNGVTKNIIKVIGPQLKHILQGTLICPPAGKTVPNHPNHFPEESLFRYSTTGTAAVDETFGSEETHQDYYSGETIAEIMVDLVKKGRYHFVDGDNCYPVIEKQGIGNLILPVVPAIDNTDSIEYSVRYMDLAQILSELSIMAQIGWDFYYDLTTNKWVFEIVQGLDKTKTQTNNNWAVFSFNRGNIKSVKYDEDFTEYRTDVVVAASEEGEQRRMYYKQNTEGATGIYNKVVFKDARDIKSGQDADYIEKNVIESRVDEAFEKNNYKQTLEISGFVGKTTLKLDVDFTLGDLVSIEVTEWGLSGNDALALQVTSVTEKADNKSLGSLDLKFGRSENTLSSLLNKRLGNYSLLITN